MIIWCVYAESETCTENFHVGCYSTLQEAMDAIHEGLQNGLVEPSIREWEVDAPCEIYSTEVGI